MLHAPSSFIASSDFPTAVSAAALPLQQSEEFARTLAALGVPLQSTAPVVIERRFGPLGRISFASRLAASQIERPPRIVNLEYPEDARMRQLGYRQIITPAHVAEWDLTRPDRAAGMTGKWRNQLRKGLSENLSLREIPWSGEDHWLFHKAAILGKTRKFRTYSTNLLSAFAKANPGRAWIFEARMNGVPAAACLVLRHGRVATYQTAWAGNLGYRTNATRVLLDRAAKRLTDWGHQRFDLGTVETEHAPGLARFKLGTGAKCRALGGTWLQIRFYTSRGIRSEIGLENVKRP